MAKKKPNWGGMSIHPDENLSKVVGGVPVTPAEMVKKLWAYIKRHQLLKRS